MNSTPRPSPPSPRRGSTLLLSVLMTTLVLGLVSSYLVLTVRNNRSTSTETLGTNALYIAEAAAAIAVSTLNDPTFDWPALAAANGVNPGVIDKNTSPRMQGALGGGRWELTLCCWGRDRVDNDGAAGADDATEDAFITVTARGIVGVEVRQLRADLSRSQGGIWWNVLFAGNSSGDTGYDFGLQGATTGPNGNNDIITGDMYVNGDLTASQKAVIDGKVTLNNGAGHDFSTGWDGNYSKGYQPIPDLNAAHYDVNHDVNVAAELNAHGVFDSAHPVQDGTTPAGGKAWQIEDPNNPAHLFRKNPNDGRIPATYPKNGKDDYFLEDPTMGLHVDPSWNGSDAAKLKVSPGGNNKVYYVDGNLWLSNNTAYSYKLFGPGLETEGVKMTIVVKGNINIADNIFYQNAQKDGIVFIALKDPDVPDSGNINFGDPNFGTVEQFNAFMYAENNFNTTNISNGSSKIIVNGTMTAGNQLNFALGSGSTHHRLQASFDDRIKTGKLKMPGLPPQPATGGGAWFAATWIRMSPTAPPILQGPKP